MACTLEENIERFLTSSIMNIHIGKKRLSYNVHLYLLNQFPGLKAGLGLRIEGMQLTGDIYLREGDREVFEQIFNWLYRRSIPNISRDSEVTAKKQAKLYVELYLKAGQFQMPGLQNSIMDTFRAHPTYALGWLPCDRIQTIYNATVEDSPLRSYIVDTFVFNSYDCDSDVNQINGDLRTILDTGNHAFLIDCYKAALSLAAKEKLIDPNRKEGCTYHVHESGGKCK